MLHHRVSSKVSFLALLIKFWTPMNVQNQKYFLTSNFYPIWDIIAQTGYFMISHLGVGPILIIIFSEHEHDEHRQSLNSTSYISIVQSNNPLIILLNLKFTSSFIQDIMLWKYTCGWELQIMFWTLHVHITFWKFLIKKHIPVKEIQ